MKNTLIDLHTRNMRRLNVVVVFAFCLFIGGLAFSISKLAAATDTEQLVAEKTVKGLIVSPDKKPIPGAVIIVQETKTGTVTDTEGNFTLDLQYFEEASLNLQVAMIGYESQDIDVKTAELPIDLGKITLEKEE